MRGWDTGANDFVYWESEGAPNLTPTTTTPALIGSLTNIAIIDEIDNIANIPPGGTTNQVLAKFSNADYDAHWADQSGGGGGSANVTIATYSMVGVVPTVMGSVTLPAGTYQAPKAKYGCANPVYVAYLVLQDSLNSAVVTFTAKPGGVSWATAPAGFTLATETELDVLLSTSDTSEIAFIHAFQLG